MEQGIAESILQITTISHDNHLNFSQKLERILEAVVQCFNTRAGSIMLLKGRRELEVCAATRPELVGVRQPLEEDAPSAWVVKNRSVLCVDKTSEQRHLTNRYDHYVRDAFLLAPIFRGQKVIGVLSVTEKEGADSFSREEKKALIAVAGQLIGTIETNRLAESLTTSRRKLAKRNAELQRLEKLRSELFNMLIHDLKGPISEVVANLDILSYVVHDDQQEFVRAAQNGCDTLYRMVCDQLDIARLEDGSLTLIPERFAARELLQEARTRMPGLAGARGLIIEEHMDDAAAGVLLVADRNLLLRVLQNLLMNAIEYSPEGGTIELCLAARDREVQFVVRDEGPGVPEKYREQIFHKFFQVKKKHDGRLYSTGLGLAFCKLAVEAHGGRIWVEDAENSGSAFCLAIPRPRN